MAIAKSVALLETVPGSIAGRLTETHAVRYIGSDIPNGTDYDEVLIENIDYSQTPAQIISFQAAAIRARAATAFGYTIGINQVLLPDLAKG